MIILKENFKYHITIYKHSTNAKKEEKLHELSLASTTQRKSWKKGSFQRAIYYPSTMLQCYKNKRRAFSPSPKMPTLGTLLLHIFISQHSPWTLQNNETVMINFVRWISHLSPFLALERLSLRLLVPCWSFLPQIEDCFCDQKMIPIDPALLAGAPDSLAGSLPTSNLLGRHFSLPSFLGLLLCPRPKSW